MNIDLIVYSFFGGNDTVVLGKCTKRLCDDCSLSPSFVFFESGDLILDDVSFANGLFISAVYAVCSLKHLRSKT